MRIARVVTNVVVTVNRRDDSTVAFLLHRTNKIARISSAVQSGFRYSSRVKAALKRETGFLRRVIECVDDEVFPGMAAGTPRQFFVFVTGPLANSRPGN